MYQQATNISGTIPVPRVIIPVPYTTQTPAATILPQGRTLFPTSLLPQVPNITPQRTPTVPPTQVTNLPVITPQVPNIPQLQVITPQIPTAPTLPFPVTNLPQFQVRTPTAPTLPVTVRTPTIPTLPVPVRTPTLPFPVRTPTVPTVLTTPTLPVPVRTPTVPTLPVPVRTPTLPVPVRTPTLPVPVRTPTLPVPVRTPTVPTVLTTPTLPVPVRTTTVPTLPVPVRTPTVPTVPTIPTLPFPVRTPTVPTVPTIPTLPVPVRTPTVPTATALPFPVRTPTVPTIPTVPTLPFPVRTPTVQIIPNTPTIPIIHRVPLPTNRVPVPVLNMRVPATAIVAQGQETETRVNSPGQNGLVINSPKRQINIPTSPQSPLRINSPPRQINIPTSPQSPLRINSPPRQTYVPIIPQVPTPMPAKLIPPVRTGQNIGSPAKDNEVIDEEKNKLLVPPNLDSPAETFINIVIGEQDADIMEEKEYLGYVAYLLNDQSKYAIFSRIFPNNTCPNVVFRMEKETSPAPHITPNENSLISCIKNKEKAGGSVAVNFSYKNHANMLWFDTDNKIINRYDPQVPGDAYGQAKMDDTIRDYLAVRFPEYVYLGNTLETWQCVQGVRGEGRTYKSDYYCQDYSLLYAINRVNGMSHEEAAFALVTRGEDILYDLAELLRALAYKVRAEMGKDVPERFRTWKPNQNIIVQ